jgi:L-rhamnose mutarotase
MKLKEGCAEEYQRRHDEIWPELQRLLTDSGIHDYSIFLDPTTHTLFAVQKVYHHDVNAASASPSPSSSSSSPPPSSQDLAGNPVVQRWWKYMADIMDTNQDHSPVVTPLREVFHLP